MQKVDFSLKALEKNFILTFFSKWATVSMLEVDYVFSPPPAPLPTIGNRFNWSNPYLYVDQ